jgi:hypothetical protein
MSRSRAHASAALSAESRIELKRQTIARFVPHFLAKAYRELFGA